MLVSAVFIQFDFSNSSASTLTLFPPPGNASQASDGAAAILLIKRSTAKRLGLPVLGNCVTSITGVPLKVMGVGPKVLSLTGLMLEDVGFLEIKEVFVSQAVMSVQHLDIGEKVSTVSFLVLISSIFSFCLFHAWSCSPSVFPRLFSSLCPVVSSGR